MDQIKFAAEIPPKVLLTHPQLRTFLDYDFVIASMYLESEEYKNYYLQNRRSGTVLDNGAFETGESIAVDAYVKVIDELRPEIVVLPDVRQNYQKTFSKVTEFFREAPLDYFTTYQFMGVLQGKSYNDWDYLLEYYISQGIDLIGIPYGTLDRTNFIRQHPDVKFHALGLQYFPELFSLRLLANVVSIDTSLPVKCAYAHIIMRHLNFITVDDRPDFEKGFDNQQLPFLECNLEFITNICNKNYELYITGLE